MRIRTQLILAAFVLAVVPLAAIVTYSYHSSRNALENAYKRETDNAAKQMDGRLSAIRAELDRRMTFVSALPLPSEGSPDAGNLAAAVGEAAPFIDALEFQPLPAPRPEPEVRTRIARAGPADPNPDPEPPDPQGNVPAPPDPRELAVMVHAAAPHPPPHPIVIDIPEMPHMPRYILSEEQKELIAEIGALGAQLGNPKLPEDEREDIAEELRDVQKELEQVVAADRARYETEIRRSREALREQRERARERQRTQQQPRIRTPQPPAVIAGAPAIAPTPAVAAVPTTPKPRKSTPTETARAKQVEKKASLILGKKYNVPVRQQGEVVGQLTARVSPEEVIQRVLGGPDGGTDEIPFAVDRENNVYTRTPAQRQTLEHVGILDHVKKKRSAKTLNGWIVSTSTDPQSGLRIGVARPVGENFEVLRRTAARNFGLGLGLIAFALIGIVPLSNHLTRDVKLVTDGAERIAHGDLMTRLPVKTKNELGQLARAFNRMAEDLSINQQKLLQQERAQKEQELQQRLMAVEFERKSVELEDARRFQLSMLPKEVPQHRAFGVGVFTQTATEVGGDYYDFHLVDDVLSVTIGDATGHGAKAGTMVTVVKTLFAAHTGAESPASFLTSAAETIKRMELGRMAMALSLGRFEGTRLTVASAGMPPALVHRRASGVVEEISQGATPLGTLGTDYTETTLDLEPGDTVLFLTDGLPELMNDSGQQFGYGATVEAFIAAAAGATGQEVVDSLVGTARRWHGDAPPNDDVTFVVVRLT